MDMSKDNLFKKALDLTVGNVPTEQTMRPSSTIKALTRSKSRTKSFADDLLNRLFRPWAFGDDGGVPT